MLTNTKNYKKKNSGNIVCLMFTVDVQEEKEAFGERKQVVFFSCVSTMPKAEPGRK